MAQVTLDYVSTKDAGAWSNFANVAVDDSNWAQATPDNVTGQMETDDAPGDYNGSTINTVKFSVIWDITATPSRAKFLTLTWRKADTTVIHTFTTPEKSSTGEQEDADAGFVTPTGTSSLTAAEWDGSYIQIVSDEGGGKGDDVDNLVDYIKIEVDYDVAAADPLEAILKPRPSPSRMWSHFGPTVLAASISVTAALAPAGYPPAIEEIQRPPSPAVQWARYAPEPLQLRAQGVLPTLFGEPDSRARISAFEQEIPDEHPPWRPGIAPAVLWEHYLPADKPIFRPPVLIDHLDDNRGARVSAVEQEIPDEPPQWIPRRPARQWDKYVPTFLTPRTVVAALADPGYPPALEEVLRAPSPARQWDKYAPDAVRPPSKRVPISILTAPPANRRARVSAVEQETPEEFPLAVILQKRAPPQRAPVALQLRPRVALVDLLDDNRGARVSAFEQQTPDHFPESLFKRGLPAVFRLPEAAPQPGPRAPAPFVFAAPISTKARISAYELQTPDKFPEGLYRHPAPAAQPVPVGQPQRRPVSIDLLAPVGNRRARVSAFEQEVPDPFPTILTLRRIGPAVQWSSYTAPAYSSVRVAAGFAETLEDDRARIAAVEFEVEYDRTARVTAVEVEVRDLFPEALAKRIERPARQWDQYAPISMTPVQVTAALHRVTDAVARVSAFEQQIPGVAADSLARISAYEMEVVEPLPAVLFEHRVSPAVQWEKYAPPELIPRSTLILVLPSNAAQVSAFEQEAPFSGARALISAFEQEVPVADRPAQVSAFELETPLRNQNAQISAFEQEAPIFEQGARISAFEQEVPVWSQEARVSAVEQEFPAVGRARVTAFEFTPDADVGPEIRRRTFAAIFNHFFRGG